ncbi:hypothetical protein G7Y89_g769 [Cudoniella acicularis]|uniref:2EXR domain-containing protein n=1 Tax=Cudoniella acicularis TaxID=354080 RepID=A0A8H4RWJ6_9HELO|nr:hypothetical protein G7Y89_g769 [Cudoniella acicularis]
MSFAALHSHFREKNAPSFSLLTSTQEKSTAALPNFGIFTLFPQLPTELRLKIWEYATSPRVVELVISSPPVNPFQDRFQYTPVPPRIEQVGMFHACQESRAIAKKRYILQPGLHPRLLVPLHPENDIVLIPSLNALDEFLSPRFWRHQGEDFQAVGISTIAIDLKFQPAAISGNGQKIFFDTIGTDTELTKLVERATKFLKDLKRVYICAGAEEVAEITRKLQLYLEGKKAAELAKPPRAIRRWQRPSKEWNVPAMAFIKYEVAPLFSEMPARNASSASISNMMAGRACFGKVPFRDNNPALLSQFHRAQ